MGEITIVGLGPGDFGLVTLKTWEAIQNAPVLLLRTAKHPTVDALREKGVQFTSYDALYETKDTFDEIYATIAKDCLNRAKAGDNIVYAVPGSPLVAERTVVLLRELAKEAGVQVKILPGMSFLEVLYVRLGIDPIEGLTVTDSIDVPKILSAVKTGLIVTQVYNRRVASEVKLSLMERYPDDYPVTFIRGLGLPEEEIREIPLFTLDREATIDHLTSVYIPPLKELERNAASFDITPLSDVMARLRLPDGCVWDREQTHISLRRNLIEEAYEVIEAIDFSDADLLCEELGDLLLQVVFHARIAEEAKQFSLQEVIDGITEKLIRRHPHVFGNDTVQNSADVMTNWEAIKRQEKADQRKSALDGVPKDLPGLMRAEKLQQKAAKVGFDWDNIEPVWDKINEEVEELKQAALGSSKAEIEAELGDVLFSVVNAARFLDVDAETAINQTNRKFKDRFSYIERQVAKNGLQWEDLTLEKLDIYWNEAKFAKKS